VEGTIMARPKSPTVTDLELEILQVLWARDGATVPEVVSDLAASGKVLAQPSIRTMLRILQRKQFVERVPAPRGYVYLALVTREQTQRNVVQSLVSRVFQGSALDLVSAVLRGDMISRKDIAKVQRMIREKEKGGRT